jgi:hypothetical protein
MANFGEERTFKMSNTSNVDPLSIDTNYIGLDGRPI